MGPEEHHFVRAAPVSPPAGNLRARSRSDTDAGLFELVDLSSAVHTAVNAYSDLPRPVSVCLSRPVAQPRSRPFPVARAESPHLLRVPRLDYEQAREWQRSLGRRWVAGLALSIVGFPMLIVLGAGLMDGIVAWHTEGEIDGFGGEEKKLAFVVGGVCCGLLAAAICVVFYVVFSSL